MTDYASIADAIKATLQADAWLGNVANVTTIEAYGRDFQFQGDDDAPFYDDAELPALSILPNVSPQDQQIETVGEIRHLVQAEVTVVSGAAGAAASARAHDAIVGNIERVLDAQKTSAADLGINALVRDVGTTTSRFKRSEKTYFISRINFIIDLTTTY